MKRIVISLIALACLLPFAGHCRAQSPSTLARIQKNGEIRVGTSGTQPPYTAKSKDSSLMGLDIDLAHRLADAMNVRVKFIERPFSDLFAALDRGEVDMIMSGISITPERNARAAFAGPYFVSGRSVLVKSQRLEALDDIVEIDRPAVTVAVLEGSTSQRFVERMAPRAKVLKRPDYESAVALLLKDKADVLIADHAICVLTMLRHPDAGLATLEIPLTLEPIGIALPPGEFLLHNMIQNYIDALMMTGELEAMHNAWFEDGSWLIRLR